jgi:hypothetical protein
MNIKRLKVILIVGLLIALIPGIPYGYFGILRIYAIIVFAILALQIPKTKQNTKNKNFIIYLVLIILFQPILKIPLGRTIWNIIDVAVAIWLLINLNRKK